MGTCFWFGFGNLEYIDFFLILTMKERFLIENFTFSNFKSIYSNTDSAGFFFIFSSYSKEFFKLALW